MKTFLFILTFISTSLFGAQGDCVSAGQTHFEADMPADSFQWDFLVIDDDHTQASLIFPRELNEAVFFQAIAQKRDNSLYEYAFPLESLDHPLTQDAVQIEFIMANEQLADLVINLQYLEQPYLECSDKKSYSYFVKTL